jgi:predicted ArsR family transcriptional regulator
MSLDSCCKRLAGLLCQGGMSTRRTLAKVVGKSGLARSTVMAHLKHMEGDGLVEKEELVQGRVGRPKVLYKPSPKLLQMSKTKSD